MQHMGDLNQQIRMCDSACENSIFDLGLEADGLNLLKCTDHTKSEQLHASGKRKDSTSNMIVSSPGSSYGNALDGMPKLSFRLNSAGDDTYSTSAEDGPELSIENIHELLGSSRFHMEDGLPRPKVQDCQNIRQLQPLALLSGFLLNHLCPISLLNFRLWRQSLGLVWRHGRYTGVLGCTGL